MFKHTADRLRQIAARLEANDDANNGGQWSEDVEFLQSVANGSDPGPSHRDELIWTAAFARHYETSSASFIQGRDQSREAFREMVEAHESRCAHDAARKADAAVYASHQVDAIALGESPF